MFLECAQILKMHPCSLLWLSSVSRHFEAYKFSIAVIKNQYCIYTFVLALLFSKLCMYL